MDRKQRSRCLAVKDSLPLPYRRKQRIRMDRKQRIRMEGWMDRKQRIRMERRGEGGMDGWMDS